MDGQTSRHGVQLITDGQTSRHGVQLSRTADSRPVAQRREATLPISHIAGETDSSPSHVFTALPDDLKTMTTDT